MQNWCVWLFSNAMNAQVNGEVAPWRGFPAPCSRGKRSSCCASSYVSGQMHLCLSCSEFTGGPDFPNPFSVPPAVVWATRPWWFGRFIAFLGVYRIAWAAVTIGNYCLPVLETRSPEIRVPVAGPTEASPPVMLQSSPLPVSSQGRPSVCVCVLTSYMDADPYG